MQYNDYYQRQLINFAKKGSIVHRDKIILYYYERIKRNLVSLNIPKEFHDDITQDCIIKVMENIYTIDFNNYKHVCAILHYIIVKQVTKSLKQFYAYERQYNGKIYRHPGLYLYALNGYHYQYQDIIKEYLEYGHIKEDIVVDSKTSDRVVEDQVIEKIFVEEYWKFVNEQTPMKQEIIKGRFPIAGCYEESGEDIVEVTGCARSYVYAEANRLKRKLLYNNRLKDYLNE